jgi:phosphoadenosine phosphosulfate reductase
MIEQIREYNKRLTGSAPIDILKFFVQEFKGQIAFATSLGAEDQVITQMLSETGHSLKIFTLDTGRMFQETYDLLDLTQKKYRINIEIYHPDANAVEGMVNEKGINLFYESVENRKLCCHIRKLEPLDRALKGMKVWISGLRRDQSVTRKELELVEYDQVNKLIKVNPLINWTEEDVWNQIRNLKIPYNPLHDNGYPSIGCLPCTRAVNPGEDIRSGRWWWELPEFKECGLHGNKK